MTGAAWFFAGIIVGLLVVWPRQGGFWCWRWTYYRLWWIGFGGPNLGGYGPARISLGALHITFPWFIGDGK